MSSRKVLELERERLAERYRDEPSSRVFAPLADVHRKLGELDEALRICQAGLARHPDYSSAYVILGKIHLERGDEDAAVRAFQEVLELDSQNLLAMRHLARLAESSGDLREAIELWETVATIDPDPESVEAHLESLRGRLGEDGAAVDASPAADAASSEPGIGPFPGQDAATAAEAERTDTDETGPRTPRSFRPGSEAGAPTSEIATITLAEIYAEQGFRSKALEIYRQVLGRHPENETVLQRVRSLEAEIRAAGRPERARPPEGVPEGAVLETAEVLSAGVADPEEFDPRRHAARPAPIDPSEAERFEHFRSWLDRVRADDED